jgi:hypothetical protein
MFRKFHIIDYVYVDNIGGPEMKIAKLTTGTGCVAALAEKIPDRF